MQLLGQLTGKRIYLLHRKLSAREEFNHVIGSVKVTAYLKLGHPHPVRHTLKGSGL